MNTSEKDVEQWLKKAADVRKGEIDLSRDEDLSIAIMNLISLEEHFFFTAMKTENQKYLDMLGSVRDLRKQLLKKIVIDPKGEEWCISKHLLAASMRLMEVGTKELAKGNTKDANAIFRQSFELYSLFFAINLKMIGKEELHYKGQQESKLKRFSETLKKLVDCCRE